MQGLPRDATEKEAPDRGCFNPPFCTRPADGSPLSTAKQAGRKKPAEWTSPEPPCPWLLVRWQNAFFIVRAGWVRVFCSLLSKIITRLKSKPTDNSSSLSHHGGLQSLNFPDYFKDTAEHSWRIKIEQKYKIKVQNQPNIKRSNSEIIWRARLVFSRGFSKNYLKNWSVHREDSCVTFVHRVCSLLPQTPHLPYFRIRNNFSHLQN